MKHGKDNGVVMQENVISTKEKGSNKEDDSEMMKDSSTGKRYRDILGKISKGSLNICDDIRWKRENDKLNGWIYFSVYMKDVGLTLSDFRQKGSKDSYGRELFSNYMMDFIGELLLRANMDKFLSFVFSIDENEYLYLVELEKHKRFGAELDTKNHKITLCFHVSILQTILTEDFKYYMI